MMFFTGYKVSPKNYISYFPKIDFIFNPSHELDNKSRIFDKVIITHSVGLIKCLNFLYEKKIQPLIIALDPPNITPEAIKNKLDTLPEDLKEIYTTYLDNKVNPTKFNIQCFRNQKNSLYSDRQFYSCIYYYKEDTHYPYQIKHIRDKILKLTELSSSK